MIITFLTGCSKATYNSSVSLAEDTDYSASYEMSPREINSEDVEAMVMETPLEAQPLYGERKLIKSGYIHFETDSIATTREQILNAMEKYKGYLSSDQENSYYGRISSTLTIRIPAEHVDSFLSDSLYGVKKFDTKNISVQDVTEEFLDVETRIHTKKEIESRYLEILKQATTVTDILAVERELGTLRADIESMEGRLNYLKNQINLSTLHITFYQEIPEAVSNNHTLWGSLRDGLSTFIGFFFALISVWPFILIGGILTVGIIKLRKR